jgi:hypothetical protein
MLFLVLSAAVGVLGFWQSKKFVTARLRFVDAVHSPWAPAIAGFAAAALALPVVGLLPIVTGATAFVFGASVAAGVVSGARDIRKRLGGA